MRELLARAMYGIAHPHGNDTQVAVGSSGARHRGSRADVTVRPQSPLTIVSRRRLRQFAWTSRISALAQGVSENSTHTIAHSHASGAMANPEMNSMFRALEVLTNQVSLLAQGSHGGGRSLDALERYRNLKMFNGDPKDYEEFSTKFRSQVAAGDKKVEGLMRAVETECTEDRLTFNQFDECKPEFDENDAEFVLTSSSEMFNLLLNLTTGEANATVRAWMAGLEKVDFVVKPEDVGFGYQGDFRCACPWEDSAGNQGRPRSGQLGGPHGKAEHGQILSAKMKVAVLYTMLPKDLQEKVLDECAVNWDETLEAEAGVLFTKIKGHIKNIAKSRREMSGPRPMEVDAVSKGYKWSEWHDSHGYRDSDSVDEHGEKTDEEEAYVQFIEKGGKKGTGKGFQGYCYVCGEFGHSQWDCNMGKGKGKGWSKGKGGYGKEGSHGKSHGKDSFYSKGSGKDGYYGKGEQGKAWMQKACFGCGSTEHLLKDCPENPKIQNVEDEAPEVLFIGNVQNRKEEEWKRIPMKVQLGDFMRAPVKRPTSTQKAKNRFKVLQVDEDDCEGGRDEVLHIRTVEDLGSNAKQHDQARVLKFGGRVQRAREAEENTDNYWATMRDEQYVQMVGENNKKGEWVSLGVGGHYHRLGSGRVVLAGGARRCFPDTAEQQEDGSENGKWRGHGALWPEGDPLQVQQRRGQRAE